MADDTNPSTQPLDPKELESDAPWSNPVNREDAEPADAVSKRVPEPLLVRAFLVAAAGLVGAVVGHQLDLTWIDDAVTLYAISAPIGLGLWARLHVSPVKK